MNAHHVDSSPRRSPLASATIRSALARALARTPWTEVIAAYHKDGNTLDVRVNDLAELPLVTHNGAARPFVSVLKALILEETRDFQQSSGVLTVNDRGHYSLQHVGQHRAGVMTA